MMTLRSATHNDLDVLLSFEQSIVTFERPFDPMLADDHINYYDLEELINSKFTEVLVAVYNDEIVGSGYAKIVRGKPYEKNLDQGYIGFLFVKPAFRRMGINKKVLDKLIEWTRSKGIREVRLHVYTENSGAVEAYEKAGFSKRLLEMRRILD